MLIRTRQLNSNVLVRLQATLAISMPISVPVFFLSTNKYDDDVCILKVYRLFLCSWKRHENIFIELVFFYWIVIKTFFCVVFARGFYVLLKCVYDAEIVTKWWIPTEIVKLSFRRIWLRFWNFSYFMTWWTRLDKTKQSSIL